MKGGSVGSALLMKANFRETDMIICQGDEGRVFTREVWQPQCTTDCGITDSE